MKKICVTINSLAEGGAEKQSLLLAASLQKNFETFVVILKDHPKSHKHVDFIQSNNIPHVYLQGSLFQGLLQFYRFLKANNIDIIFSYLPRDTLIGAIIGKIAGVKYIFGGIRNSFVEYHKFLTLKYLHNYILDYSISNSYSGSDESIKRGFKKEKIFVIPNGIEPQPDFVERPNKNDIVITTIGRFVEQKDYLTSIKSISYLIQNLKPDAKIIYKIIGHGSLQNQIEDWVKAYGISHCTEIVTNITNSMPILYESDIYLSTSLYEGVSNSIMEAMNCGLPIVATKAGDNDILVKNDINGFLVEQKAHIDIANKLFELVQSHGKRIEFGLNSYNIIINEFSTDRFSHRYIELIERLR
jgi:glycosyltransferase involved in cell wall biosynthesis